MFVLLVFRRGARTDTIQSQIIVQVQSTRLDSLSLVGVRVGARDASQRGLDGYGNEE